MCKKCFLAWMVSWILLVFCFGRVVNLFRKRSNLFMNILSKCVFKIVWLFFFDPKIRRKIRPMFQKNQFTIYLYSFITWFCTMLATSYAIVPYFLLQFWMGITFYNSFFWYVQIICVLAIVLLPTASTKKPKAK